ncbi:hypothetical protein, partial [uncultured Dialister sp.]|uniref:hypothetical protein n=1 Tax=uncultured Dialister sp. TaxID=278064 RepID=UPI0027DD290F
PLFKGWVASAASRKGLAVRQQVEMKLHAVVPPPKAAYKIHYPKGNPHPSAEEPPSNLRTLLSKGPVKLKNLLTAP